MAKLTAAEFQQLLETTPIPFETYDLEPTGELDKWGNKIYVREADGRLKHINHRIDYFFLGEPAPEENPDNWPTEGGWNELLEVVDRKDGLEVDGLGHLYLVENFGGEGQGDQYYFVLKLVRPDAEDQFFLMPGYYASYDGGYYDGTFTEVKPVERLVTFYE